MGVNQLEAENASSWVGKSYKTQGRRGSGDSISQSQEFSFVGQAKLACVPWKGGYMAKGTFN